MPALLLIVAGLVVNILRARKGKSTICSVTRPLIPIPVFLAVLGAFLAWFPWHWIRPKLRNHN